LWSEEGFEVLSHEEQLVREVAGELRLFRVVKLRQKSFGAASGVVARSGAR
jgi:hypothetical protein